MTDSGELVGIASLDDLLLEELGALAWVIRRGGKARPHRRPPTTGQMPKTAVRALQS